MPPRRSIACSIALSIALSILAACGGGSGGAVDAGPPLDPCTLTSEVPGGACEVGLGTAFTPIASGQSVALELGSQGLWMFLVSGRVPASNVRAGDLVGVSAVARLESTGELASLEFGCRARVLAEAPGDAGALDLESPYLLPMRPELASSLEGARVTLILDVRDPDGTAARDMRTVVAHIPGRAR